MWYRHPTPEEELAATALLRAQVNLFTHPSRSYFEETAEEKKIHEENLLHLLANDVNEGVVRVLLMSLEYEMRYRVAMEARLKSMGWDHFMDLLRPEYSAETTTEEMLKYLDYLTAETVKDQLRQDQQSGNGDDETAA
jgi:hypothetical protein